MNALPLRYKMPLVTLLLVYDLTGMISKSYRPSHVLEVDGLVSTLGSNLVFLYFSKIMRQSFRLATCFQRYGSLETRIPATILKLILLEW